MTYHEKPGISCLNSVCVKAGRYLLVQGGFDFRVRVFSLKTLKQLVNLEFHKGIVNSVFVEKDPLNSSKVNIFSVSEDGYLAFWNL